MGIKESSNDCLIGWGYFPDVPKFLKSPLITTLALSAIAMAVLPFTLGATAFGLTLAGFVLFPHLLPKGLLYEVSVLDLMVRAKLSRTFPSLGQSWWHQILPNLFLGGIPLANQHHLEQISSLGARYVLAILEGDEAETETFFSTPLRRMDWERAGIGYRRLSCKDMHPMSLEELETEVLWLHKRIAAGECVYVHCKAGRGRSAMIVLGYLIYIKKMSVKEAINYVSSIRSVIRLRPAQVERLEEFSNLSRSRAR